MIIVVKILTGSQAGGKSRFGEEPQSRVDSMNLWQETPLMYSEILSNILDASVHLKLEVAVSLHSFN